MSRRTKLWALGLASLAVFLVLALIDRRMQDAGGHGIIEFELTGSVAGAQEILGDWGDEGQDAARASLWVDFLYLALYGSFLFLAARAIADGAAARGFAGLQRAGRLAASAAVVAAACDAVENVFLLMVIDELRDGSPAPVLAATFAGTKFALAAVAVLTILVGLVRLKRA